MGMVAADITEGELSRLKVFSIFVELGLFMEDEAFSLIKPELYFFLELTLSRVVIELHPSLITLSAICANCLSLASSISRCFFSLNSISLS
jgi:hypothetical protein